MAPITLYSFSRDHADADGGQQLIILGDFTEDIGKPMVVHVGPAGDITDPRCLSGVAGRGRVIYSLGVNKLQCFFPTLPPGGPYDIYIHREDMARAGTFVAAVTVLPKRYYSSVFDIRTALPPFYRTGPRSMDLLEAL